jgi:hypothetical protein
VLGFHCGLMTLPSFTALYLIAVIGCDAGDSGIG